MEEEIGDHGSKIEDPPRSGDTPIRRAIELPKKPREALFHSQIQNQQSSIVNLPLFSAHSALLRLPTLGKKQPQMDRIYTDKKEYRFKTAVFVGQPHKQGRSFRLHLRPSCSSAVETLLTVPLSCQRNHAKEQLMITTAGRDEVAEKLKAMSGKICVVS